MSVNCSFAVMSHLPEVPNLVIFTDEELRCMDVMERQIIERENKVKLVQTARHISAFIPLI